MGYASGHRPVFSSTPIHLALSLRSPRVITAIGVGVATAVGVASYVMMRRTPPAEEVERERRDLLARSGRITDGTIMDTMIMEAHGTDPKVLHTPVQTESSGPTPDIIVYNYRIAGVTYECAQDVTALADSLRRVLTTAETSVEMGQRALERIRKWNFEQDVRGLRLAIAAVTHKIPA